MAMGHAFSTPGPGVPMLLHSLPAPWDPLRAPKNPARLRSPMAGAVPLRNLCGPQRSAPVFGFSSPVTTSQGRMCPLELLLPRLRLPTPHPGRAGGPGGPPTLSTPSS